jgi:hypothetical protein
MVVMVRVKVLAVLPGGRRVGLKVAVAPGGRPVAARTMGLLSVPWVWALKVKVAVLPAGIVWLEELDGARVKSAGVVVVAEMVRVAGVEVLGWKLESPE